MSGFLHAAPQLSSDVTVSHEGYFVLSWDNADVEAELTLQQAGNPGFSGTLETWPVTDASQFTQSGLFDGEYYFRLVDANGFSNTVMVQVQHHSLTRAAVFFTLGAALFGILIVTLLVGQHSLSRGTMS